MSPAEITGYWFGELAGGLADDAHRRRWFASNPARDAEIRDRFQAALAAARRGELDAWRGSAVGSLGLVILCDQFSRQIHRATAEAYATDPLALATARSLIERGEDQALGPDERAFLYMPYQHAESRPDQHTSVGLYSALRDNAAEALRGHAEGFLEHARQHRDIVLRFGRFPHRNQLLGRESTAEEVEFLKTASDFGQSSGTR